MADFELKKKLMEEKKAELRVRMEVEAAGKAKSKKKSGFMNPERKTKLRTFLRKKAAEELKKEQGRKAIERQIEIEKRCGQPKRLESINSETELMAICMEYIERLAVLEGEKYDVDYQAKIKNLEIKELKGLVNDTRGKFVKPPMKKVPKFSFLKQIPAQKSECNFKDKLKPIKKDIIHTDDLDLEKSKERLVWTKSTPKQSDEI